MVAEGLITLASLMAPTPLIMPAPWIRRLTDWPVASCMLKAVYSKMVLIAFGVSGFPPGNAVRFASMTSAASPETTPADMLVPVKVR